MSAKSGRRGISAAPPAVPETGAEAFVKGAAVHVSTAVPDHESSSVPATAAKSGRPRKYADDLKALTIRVSLDAYDDLRYLVYRTGASGIQEVAQTLLEQSARERRAEVDRDGS